MPIEPGKIEAFAKRFRAAIERTSSQDLMITLRSFPKGACGDTCLLLGTALIEQDLGIFRYWCATKIEGDKFDSHAWLSTSGLIVDITADQFNDGMPSVFVGEDCGWYARWNEPTDLGAGDFRLWHSVNPLELRNSYEAIIANLPPV